MRIRFEIAEAVYVGLMTNLLLALACLPPLAVLLLTDLTRSWPLLALTAPAGGPALCAAFAVLARFNAERSTTVAATFVRTWLATARRASLLAALATALLTVLGVDARAAWGRPIGAAAIPVLAVVVVLVTATALLALAILAERPATRLRVAARAALFLAVRRWYLTVFSLFVLAALEAAVTSKPAIGLGLAATPLLYVVWANSRVTLAPVLPPGPA